jgi:hypothetical protein
LVDKIEFSDFKITRKVSKGLSRGEVEIGDLPKNFIEKKTTRNRKTIIEI